MSAHRNHLPSKSKRLVMRTSFAYEKEDSFMLFTLRDTTLQFENRELNYVSRFFNA